MTVLKVGAIMGDIGLQRGRPGAVFRTVASKLRRLDVEEPPVELVFDFPGRLSTPDYRGIKLQKLRGTTRAMISVPSEAVGSPSLDATLYGLAGEALRAAGATHSRLPDGGLRPIEDVLPELRPGRGITDRAREVGDSQMAAAMVELQWPLGQDVAGRMEQFATLETRLDVELRDSGWGYVDGHEAGEGVYSLFISVDPTETEPAIALATKLAHAHLGETPTIAPKDEEVATG
jgi:hypothetical protein